MLLIPMEKKRKLAQATINGYLQETAINMAAIHRGLVDIEDDEVEKLREENRVLWAKVVELEEKLKKFQEKEILP